MNYKLLFPTYRARQGWVLGRLAALGQTQPIARMLNVGCGEGDIDGALRSQCRELVSCDVNSADVAHARALNGDVEGLEYLVADAAHLPFADASFDAATCLEVIEHVDHPRAVLAELARVLRPGAPLVLTCPSAQFPLTYDPVNWVLSRLGTHVGVGAFGYGHDWLVREAELEVWCAEAGLRVREREHLSKTGAGAFEAYWPGLLQRVLKANAGNREHGEPRRALVRPSRGDPPLVALTDALVELDARLFGWSRASVGLAYVLEKSR